MRHIFNTIASILVVLLASCSKPEYRFVDGIGYQINSLPMEMLDAQELEMCIKIDSLSIYGIEINERGEKVLLVDKKDFKKLGVPISFFKDMRMQVKHLKKMIKTHPMSESDIEESKANFKSLRAGFEEDRLYVRKMVDERWPEGHRRDLENKDSLKKERIQKSKFRIPVRISGPPGSGTLRGVDTVIWRKDIRTVTSPM